MTTIAPYLLKVILCSGIMFLYYHVALRNNVFHQWNRFYLLAAVVLSLVLPFVQFTFLVDTSDQSNAAALLRSFQQANNTLEEFVVTGKQVTTPEQWLLLGYGAISLSFFLLLLYSFYRITTIIRTHTVQRLDKVKFVNTSINGAPFSFFDYIFWHQDIPLQSSTGRQIFQHEMVHVEEKHSFDKLFLQVVLIFCWCNPFFWLIRKELTATHEFSADQKSINGYDTSAFAAMLLHAAYPKQYQSLINPFFQTSIKRRLAMLTKMQNPVVSYISRIVALPLLAATVLAFTARTTGSTEAENGTSAENITLSTQLRTNEKPASDTLPDKTKVIQSVDVRKDAEKKIAELTITYADGTSEKITAKEAVKRGLLNNEAINNSPAQKDKAGPEKGIQIRETGPNENQPLFFLDGKEISKEEMNKIDPNTIESVNVLKDKHAIDKYGEKGRHGVVEIVRKKGLLGEHSSEPVFQQTEVAATVDLQSWRQFLEKNIQPLKKELDLMAPAGQYTVNVRFIVNKDGSLSEFEALNDPGHGIAAKVVQMMKTAPKWKPALQNGYPVRSYHMQPITFVLQGSAGDAATAGHRTYLPEELLALNLHQLTGAAPGDEILSCRFTIDTDEGDVRVASNQGNALSQQANQLLLSASKGKTLTIDAILVQRGEKRIKMPAKVYRL